MQKTIIKSLHPYGDFLLSLLIKIDGEKISTAILKIKAGDQNVVAVTGRKNNLNNTNDKKLE